MSVATVFRGLLGKRKFGALRRKQRDPLDKLYTPGDRLGLKAAGKAPKLGKLDDWVSIEKNIPQLYDQGATGSCVWQALANAIAASEIAQGLPYDPPSRREGYRLTRTKDGIEGDEGCYPDTAFQLAARYGVASELIFPWSELRINENPSASVIFAGDSRRGLTYEYLRGTPAELHLLVREAHAEGLPVFAAAQVGRSFQRFLGGGVYDTVDPNPVGGHAFLLVTSAREGQTPLHKLWNSWGDWADQGTCWIGPRFFSTIDVLAVVHGWKRSARQREQLTGVKA